MINRSGLSESRADIRVDRSERQIFSPGGHPADREASPDPQPACKDRLSCEGRPQIWLWPVKSWRFDPPSCPERWISSSGEEGKASPLRQIHLRKPCGCTFWKYSRHILQSINLTGLHMFSSGSMIASPHLSRISIDTTEDNQSIMVPARPVKTNFFTSHSWNLMGSYPLRSINFSLTGYWCCSWSV